MAYEGYKETHVHGPWQIARVICWYVMRPWMTEEVPINRLFSLEIDERYEEEPTTITITPLTEEEKKELQQKLNGHQ